MLVPAFYGLSMSSAAPAQALDDSDCYHNFCRLLGRLKANYQLSELVKTEGYEEWLRLAAEFAVHSFSQMHVSARVRMW